MLELRAQNGLIVRLRGDELEVEGPTATTGEMAGQQLAFGPSWMTGGRWGLSDHLARFAAEALTPGDPTDLVLERRDARSRFGPPIRLPGVPRRDAEALLARLREAEAAAAEAIEVTPQTLLANPAAFHGRLVRVEGLGVTAAFESNSLWHPDVPPTEHGLWHDIPLPEGTWWVEVEGIVEAGDRGYGHFGMWKGQLRTRRLFGRCPAGALLAAQVGETAQRAAAEALSPVMAVPRPRWSLPSWLTRRRPVQPEGPVEVVRSLPYPVEWPPTGADRRVCFYFSTRGGPLWARACVALDRPDASPAVEPLTGPAPAAADPHAAFTRAAIHAIALGVETGRRDPSLDAFVRLVYGPTLTPGTAAAHRAFADWLRG